MISLLNSCFEFYSKFQLIIDLFDFFLDKLHVAEFVYTDICHFVPVT